MTLDVSNSAVTKSLRSLQQGLRGSGRAGVVIHVPKVWNPALCPSGRGFQVKAGAAEFRVLM